MVACLVSIRQRLLRADLVTIWWQKTVRRQPARPSHFTFETDPLPAFEFMDWADMSDAAGVPIREIRPYA